MYRLLSESAVSGAPPPTSTTVIVTSSGVPPPGTDGTACFLALTGSEAGVELCVTLPRRLAGGRRIDALLDALEADLGAGA